MTQTTDTTRPEGSDDAAAPPTRLGRNDPLLQELWAIKAAMNAEAGYSVKTRAAQSREFDPESTLARLRQQVSH